jgi:predicted phosphodiesterase
MSTPKRTVVGELARTILRQFPKAPSLQLANILCKQHPKIFRNIEQARNALRYYRGAIGKHGRRDARASIVSEAVRTEKESNEVRATATCALPVSDAKPWLPYHIDDQVKSVGILADIHIPYHDTEALEKAIEAMRKRNPDIILLNGDVTDCHRVSRWEQDPRLRRFKDELVLTSQFFDYLRNRLPNAEIIWKLGNHEERYFHYLAGRAPELLDLPSFQPEVVFDLAGRGARIIGDKRIIRCGKLPIVHGHEFQEKGAGVYANAARAYYAKAKGSVLASHSHQRSEHAENNIKHEQLAAWCTGCLCDLHPEYARLNRWSHGWAFVAKDSAGNYEVENLAIR